MKIEYISIKKCELEELLKELVRLRDEFERLHAGSAAMDRTKEKRVASQS